MARHKATVVAAVRAGRITMEEALHRYQLSEEEFLSWQRVLESHGLPGLRATFFQQYREPRQPRRIRKRIPRSSLSMAELLIPMVDVAHPVGPTRQRLSDC